jgi:hypothetical protein
MVVTARATREECIPITHVHVSSAFYNDNPVEGNVHRREPATREAEIDERTTGTCIAVEGLGTVK